MSDLGCPVLRGRYVIYIIKSCFDEAEGRVNLGNKKLFSGSRFVKNSLAKMPLDQLMSKNTLKSLTKIF